MSGGYPGIPGQGKVNRTPMDRGVGGKKPCARCGILVEPSHHKGGRTSGICRDCRWVDPEFVESQATGQPILHARTMDRPPQWADARRREWQAALGEEAS